MAVALPILKNVCRHNLSVAVLFWAGWLVLALWESAAGMNTAIGVLYSLSIPLLVVLLTFASLHLLLLVDLRQRLLGVALLGTSVLVSASLITMVGMLAAASLKRLVS